MSGAEVVQVFEIPCEGFVTSRFIEPLYGAFYFDKGHMTGHLKVHRHYELCHRRASRLLWHQKNGERPNGGAEVIQYSVENIDTGPEHTKVEMGCHVTRERWSGAFRSSASTHASPSRLWKAILPTTHMSSKLVSSPGFHDCLCVTLSGLQCTRTNQPCLNGAIHSPSHTSIDHRLIE